MYICMHGYVRYTLLKEEHGIDVHESTTRISVCEVEWIPEFEKSKKAVHLSTFSNIHFNLMLM